MFRDVVRARIVGQIPIAGEDLAENGVEWLFNAPIDIALVS